jgi:2-polyprenyl-3-methyl-5-hydroxy-6-metoxy-1,4-benzoquinol methylase
MQELPDTISHDRTKFQLKWIVPRIWTQRASRAFGIYWSSEIRHGILFPYPTDLELQEFYNTQSYDQYLGCGNLRPAVATRSFIERVVMKLAYLADRSEEDCAASIMQLCKSSHPSICDIGCGSGAFLAEMRSRGAIVTGVDPSSVSGNAIRSRGIEFHCGTAEVIPSELRSRRFDVVTMLQSLEHCRDPKEAVSNASMLLNEAGLLVLDVPNIDCLGARMYRQTWWHTDAGRHLQFFTPFSLTRLCKISGLEVVRTEYAGFTHQFSRTWIDDMANAWDRMFGKRTVRDIPPRASLARSWSYLLPALAAPKGLKYEVVRVYARPSDISATLKSQGIKVSK